MKKKDLLITNNIKDKYYKKKLIQKYSKSFKGVISDLKLDILNSKKTLNILDKKFKINFKIKDLEKFKKFKSIVLIGMGGSILGAEAINNFLEKKIKKKIFFLDDINQEKIFKLKKIKNFNKSLFLIISKSGNTIETISNLFSLNIIKKNSKNLIFISEKKNNFITNLVKDLNLFYIEHKNFIGGRFSVLSEVGLIPGYLMGIDIKKLRAKIQTYLKGKEASILKENSIKLASLYSSKKLNNIIFINYAPELEKFLFWSQQLIAESLGKKNKGFLPIISNTPKDHHSLLQLYLDGPKDKLFYVFSINLNSKEKLKIKKITKLSNFLDQKTLSCIKSAQKNALIETFKKKQIPFREFKINQINEQTLGKLFSYFILETIIVGKLNNIDPYNQPAVEQVKVLTKKLLS